MENVICGLNRDFNHINVKETIKVLYIVKLKTDFKDTKNIIWNTNKGVAKISYFDILVVDVNKIVKESVNVFYSIAVFKVDLKKESSDKNSAEDVDIKKVNSVIENYIKNYSNKVVVDFQHISTVIIGWTIRTADLPNSNIYMQAIKILNSNSIIKLEAEL